MLRNLGIISVVLFASQLLTIVQQCFANKNTTWMCQNDEALAFRVSNDGQGCHCLFVPQFEPASIGEGYWREPGVGLYKIHTKGATWNEARKICHNEGAYLAVINSPEEMQTLNNLLEWNHNDIEADTDSHAYVGLHSHFGEEPPHFWTSVVGEWVIPDTFNPWFRRTMNKDCPQEWDDQPDGHGEERCGALIRPCKAMADVKCDKKLAFLCEKPEPCP